MLVETERPQSVVMVVVLVVVVVVARIIEKATGRAFPSLFEIVIEMYSLFIFSNRPFDRRKSITTVSGPWPLHIWPAAVLTEVLAMISSVSPGRPLGRPAWLGGPESWLRGATSGKPCKSS